MRGRRHRGRMFAALLAVAVAFALVPAVASASTGGADDGDDATAPLDLSRVLHRDDASTLSWELTSHSRFSDTDVTTCLWSMEELGRQVSAAWDAGARAIVGLARDASGRATASAHVVRTSSTTLRVSVRRADVASPSSYRYFVTCLSDADGDGHIGSGESDAVPDGSRLITHSVSDATAADPVRRIAGSDRVATAIALSRDGWRDDAATTVVLASSDDFADALAGTPLAGAHRAPVLLNPTGVLDPRVAAEIDRLLPASGGTVYALGGEQALSEAVTTGLDARGWSVRRVSGADRYATAVAVAGELGDPSTVLLADGVDFPDALAAGAAAAHVGGALLLTEGTTTPDAVRRYFDDHAPGARFTVGAAAATADPAAVALVGVDRYDTTRKVNDRFFAQPTSVIAASGVTFPDALAAGARAAASGAPLVLVAPRGVPNAMFSWLLAEAPSVRAAGVVGGTRVATDEVVIGLLDAIN